MRYIYVLVLEQWTSFQRPSPRLCSEPGFSQAVEQFNFCCTAPSLVPRRVPSQTLVCQRSSFVLDHDLRLKSPPSCPSSVGWFQARWRAEGRLRWADPSLWLASRGSPGLQNQTGVNGDQIALPLPTASLPAPWRQVKMCDKDFINVMSLWWGAKPTGTPCIKQVILKDIKSCSPLSILSVFISVGFYSLSLFITFIPSEEK